MSSIKKEYSNSIVYKNKQGKYHREDGPAIEHNNGTKSWFINGKRHRGDGPAREWSIGTKEWWINGKLHREDGPAIEYASGDKSWFLNDIDYTEEQWSQEVTKIKLKRILYL